MDYWQGANVKCGRHRIARSVTGAQCHGRSVTGVHGSAWFHGLQQCIVYSRAWECSYQLNDQPVRERVTASCELKHVHCIWSVTV